MGPNNQTRPLDDATQHIADIAHRSQSQRRQFHARSPKPLGKVLARLLAKNNYGATETNRQLEAAWTAAAGARLAPFSRAIRVNRGRLEVLVAHSPMMQEITFEKQRILTAIRAALPDARIDDLKLRVGKL